MPPDEEEGVAAATESFQETVNSNPNSLSSHFELGMHLWKRREKSQEMREKAVEHFMAAAKLEPQNAVVFRYLGHYFSGIERQRALKCYQRAVVLNPDDSEAGEAYCILLDDDGKESLVLVACQEASEKSPKAFWAFRQLGFFQAHKKKWSEAIQSLQHAIRGIPTCADSWETLGLAYQRMGMFTAALKSYGRAVELDASRVFALVESGNICLMLGSYREGIKKFQQALEISPGNISVLYGLASGLLGFAKECASLGALKWAASTLEEASEVIIHSTLLVGNFSCSWKLLGDIKLLQAKCHPWVQETMHEHFDESFFRSSIDAWKKARLMAARMARSAYQRALHLEPWQANAYVDVAIATGLCLQFQGPSKQDLSVWPVAEKMCVGSVLLEGHKEEFWVALGCLADHTGLKQHALIRALQLNVSLAVAWAYLGKFYRQHGDSKLAQQAFDRARSIDPSLGLPWAGMSADAATRNLDQNEAYECCLRAVQISPLAEFQVGLANLALRSSCLSSSEVFAAIQQALERLPHYPESHNLSGLVCESRFDYQSAIKCYRLAKCALLSTEDESYESRLRHISINLARSCVLAGDVGDAAEECQNLMQTGQLDVECLHIYALCLWKLGKKDMALSVTRSIASHILSMEENMVGASASFICRMLYQVSGQEAAITSILRMPKDLFKSSQISFVVSAIHVLDRKNLLESIVSGTRSFVTSQDEIIWMHILITLGKLLKSVQGSNLGFNHGINHLKKALHMYPNSNALRNLLSYLLLSKDVGDSHLATRCLLLNFSEDQKDKVLKSPCEIFGAANVACYTPEICDGKFSFRTCRSQVSCGSGAIRNMQKFLHQEPWNFNARYLLTLSCYQKAREEKFPENICRLLKRLTDVAFSNQLNPLNGIGHYQHFQLLLCVAEVNLQLGNKTECFRCVKSALASSVLSSYLFFGHLLLCRAYSLEYDVVNLSKEYRECLELGTHLHTGWIGLKFIESKHCLDDYSNELCLRYESCSVDLTSKQTLWPARFKMVEGLISVSLGDFVAAEHLFWEACSLADDESYLFLCHGAVCMEVARRECDSQYISLAIRSLKRVKNAYPYPLPMVSLLLAQAEGSLGSKAKWGSMLEDEWRSWPSGTRPAEVMFQMHLLARQKMGNIPPSSNNSWILRAIHMNPSCSRYWKCLLEM